MNIQFSVATPVSRYNGYALTYKEITHRDDRYRHGYVWTKTHTFYRWEKRQASKFERRNARAVIAEYEDFDYELYDLMTFWLTYIFFMQDMYFLKALSALAAPWCEGPGYCHICDGRED